MSGGPRDRTAPDAASGAVPASGPTAVPVLRARDFWRAVVSAALDTLTPWPR
ncbi:hypothetical protein [uncultured Phycicoccus sp.]|uniref:hypothetical protein n=1 Tax=uncultured Phycicoccus sp. TaxID=661422 RepID=UPI00261769D1|nr:hypothetical protein [uncultured Phycicoccus sp.]